MRYTQGRLLREDRDASTGGITNNQAANPTATATDNRTWTGLDGANNWNEVDANGAFDSLDITKNEVFEYTSVATNSGTPVSRTYDPNGNLTDDGTNEYFYDAFNRLVRVERKSDNEDIGLYGYDAHSRRVRRKFEAAAETFETVVYYYLGGRVLEEFDESFGEPLVQYTWGGEGLLHYHRGWIRFYVHENGYGSVVRTSNDLAGEPTSKELWDRFRYNAYGEVVNTGTQTTGLEYGFKGLRRDDETGLDLVGRGRFSDPILGVALGRGAGFLENRYVAFSPSPLWLWAQAGPATIPIGDEQAADGCTDKPFACGADITGVLIEHLNEFASAVRETRPEALLEKLVIAQVEAHQVASTNGWRLVTAAEAAPGCASGICRGTVTFGEKCLSGYNVQHTFWQLPTSR